MSIAVDWRELRSRATADRCRHWLPLVLILTLLIVLVLLCVSFQGMLSACERQQLLMRKEDSLYSVRQVDIVVSMDYDGVFKDGQVTPLLQAFIAAKFGRFIEVHADNLVNLFVAGNSPERVCRNAKFALDEDIFEVKYPRRNCWEIEGSGTEGASIYGDGMLRLLKESLKSSVKAFNIYFVSDLTLESLRSSLNLAMGPITILETDSLETTALVITSLRHSNVNMQ